MDISDITLVEHRHPAFMNDELREMLKDGWQPMGPVRLEDLNGSPRYHITMVKYKRETL